MFRKASPVEENKTQPAVNLIAPGAVLEGTLRVQGDLRLAGMVSGQLQADGKIVIAPEGQVEGRLEAACADIAGSVRGDVRAERITLRATARVEGQLICRRFVVEDGAEFEGECRRMELSSSEGMVSERTTSDGTGF
jgi:cytoskeletal protein CcmA (bactofilin family)|nr:MAG: hypothetical protein KatS3mg041_1068 [Bacteroidota bacterium]